MAAPNYHNYTSVSGSTSTNITSTKLENHPKDAGNYHSAETWSGGFLSATDHRGTWDAFLISGSAGIIPGAQVTVAGNGATIEIKNFADHKLFEIGISSISGSAIAGGEVYLFHRTRRAYQ